MKKLAILLAIVAVLSGCETIAGLSENEKQTFMWVGGFLGMAAIISAADGDSTTIITECQRTGNKGCD